ncbi:hypothetical protein M0R45_022030 [Rubus argutus]|uniref:Uncharacterized protein n=1 Tax=Rubus argutus TaxID=59490 RepID=A0AAW1XFD9_RUBAR
MSISSGNSHDHPHILVYPYPAQGHMLPLLDLTNQLALGGLTITIVVTPKNLPMLTPLLSTHPSIQTLVLPFPAHPKIPPGVENGGISAPTATSPSSTPSPISTTRFSSGSTPTLIPLWLSSLISFSATLSASPTHSKSPE